MIKTIEANHDITVIKKYLEGALSVEGMNGLHSEGYRLAIQNVYNFVKLVEKGER